jgi:hypothetical protein
MKSSLSSDKSASSGIKSENVAANQRSHSLLPQPNASSASTVMSVVAPSSGENPYVSFSDIQRLHLPYGENVSLYGDYSKISKEAKEVRDFVMTFNPAFRVR